MHNEWTIFEDNMFSGNYRTNLFADKGNHGVAGFWPVELLITIYNNRHNLILGSK